MRSSQRIEVACHDDFWMKIKPVKKACNASLKPDSISRTTTDLGGLW